MASFMIDAKPLAKALTLLARAADKPSRYSGRPDVLSHVLIDVDEGGRCDLVATNLDSFVRITLAADCITPGRVCAPAVALRDGIKKLGKKDRACLTLADDGELRVASGRTRVSLPTLPADDFPAVHRATCEPAEQWGLTLADEAARLDCRSEGLQVSPDAAKLLTAFAAHAKGGEGDATASRFEPEGKAVRFVIAADGVSVGVTAAEPELDWRWKPQRNPFAFDPDGAELERCATYLRDLRDRLGLPASPEGDAGRLEYREGIALGITFGEGYWDSSEYRPASGFAPPAGTEIINEGSAFEECEVDGVRYARSPNGVEVDRDDLRNVWHRYHVGTNAFTYPEGSYSLPMPREVDRCVAVEFVEVAGLGERVPLGKRSSGTINLTAERVAELCGPVDPSTFVAIPALACHHGRIIATGEAAERFNAMQADYFATSRRALKNCRNMAERVLTADNLAAQWSAKVERFLETGRDPGFVAEPRRVAPAEPIAADLPAPAAADPVPDPVVADPMPEPTNVIAVDFARSPAAPAVEPSTAVALAVAVEAEPEPEAEGRQAAAADVGSLSDRLARVEAALGLTPAPKRSPAHAAAIRRAWAMRRQMRERAALDRAALLQVNGYNRIMREEAERLAERLKRAEAFIEERAELVAEIDRLRGIAASWTETANRDSRRRKEARTGKHRIAKRAAALRRELGRARAMAAGVAHNLALVTARCAEAEATASRLQADRPSLVLTSR